MNPFCGTNVPTPKNLHINFYKEGKLLHENSNNVKTLNIAPSFSFSSREREREPTI